MVFFLIDGSLGKLPISIILSKIEVVPLQNDVTLTTAFEGEDIPSFGVFTDHQVDLTLDQSPWHLLDFDQAV